MSLHERREKLAQKLGLRERDSMYLEGVEDAVEALDGLLERYQDAQGVDTWPARRALRELLEGGGDG